MADSLFGNGAGISFSGLSSGIDTQALIEALVGLEQKPIETAKAKQKKLQSLSGLVTTLSKKLSALRDAAAGLTTLAQGLAYTATSSDATKVTATANSAAAVGPHKISVTQLASAATSSAAASTTITSASAALTNSGKLTVNYAGTTTVLDVTGKSLNEIKDLVNQGVEGVNASVVNVGTSTSPDYRLVVSGGSSGAANTLSFSVEAGVDLAFTAVTSAQNAQFTIDGIAVQRETNTFSDVIDGVSLTLLGTTATGSDVTVTVSADSAAVKGKIKKLVDAYNDIASFLASNSTYDPASKIAGAFFGDNSINSIKSQLTSLVSKGGAAFTANEGTNALSMLGIKLQSDGTLQLDDVKLSKKLDEGIEKVLDLFADTDGATGADAGLANLLRDFADAATTGGTDAATGASYDGLLEAKTKSISQQIASLQKTIDQGEVQVAKYAQSLKLKFAAFEEAMTQLKAQQSALYAKFGV